MAKPIRTYRNAAGSSHGLMICGTCNQRITEGEYRVGDLPEKYVTHHRACCSDDPAWAKRDRGAASRKARDDALEAAARKFIARWGVVDLSDYSDECSA